MSGTWLNDPQIDDALVEFNTSFFASLDKVRGQDMFWQSAATQIPSRSRVTNHKWLSGAPGMRRWLGDRKVSKFTAHDFEVLNYKWESTVEFTEDDWEDDQLGLLEPEIQSMPARAMAHRDELLVAWLALGFDSTNTYEGIEVGTAYDGVSFFSDSHASGDNLLTASLDDSGCLDDARELLALQKDDNGRPFGSIGSVLVCGPAFQSVAEGLVEAALIGGGNSNTNFNRMGLHVSPLLTDNALGNSSFDWANYWFLLDLREPIRPLGFQMRRELRFRRENFEFKDGKALAGCDARYSPFYGFHQKAVGSRGTA